MYCTPAKTLTARVPHQCTYCGEAIEPGEAYLRWASYDDTCFTNKMHPECADDLAENGDGEYSPGQGERPKLQFTAMSTE